MNKETAKKTAKKAPQETPTSIRLGEMEGAVASIVAKTGLNKADVIRRLASLGLPIAQENPVKLLEAGAK